MNSPGDNYIYSQSTCGSLGSRNRWLLVRTIEASRGASCGRERTFGVRKQPIANHGKNSDENGNEDRGVLSSADPSWGFSAHGCNGFLAVLGHSSVKVCGQDSTNTYFAQMPDNTWYHRRVPRGGWTWLGQLARDDFPLDGGWHKVSRDFYYAFNPYGNDMGIWYMQP